jgi:hypothetical protein
MQKALETRALVYLPQQFLYFFPDPHGRKVLIFRKILLILRLIIV